MVLNPELGCICFSVVPSQQGGDLTADARLVTENVELLAWYLQNDRLAVAHVAICLLEGPHQESKEQKYLYCNCMCL